MTSKPVNTLFVILPWSIQVVLTNWSL